MRIKRLVKYSAAAAALASAVFLTGAARRPSGGPDGEEISRDARSQHYFRLRELGGETEYTLDDFGGKPLFIDFWASWCPPCRSSAPYVERLAEEFEGDVNVIGINLDATESDAFRFLEEHQSSILHLAGYNSDVPVRYGVRGIPTFFILDESGRVEVSHSGFTPAQYGSWVETLNRLLER